MYRSLKSDKVVETIATLENRIKERFPESGLSKVAAELHRIGQATVVRSARIQRPNLVLRAVVGLLVCGIIGLLLVLAFSFPIVNGVRELPDFIQFLQNTLSSIVFVGATVLFLLTLEARLKRRRALAAIYELRAMAHIIDMHQLTKDPERARDAGRGTASSPKRKLSPFELGRYLDYCSEMLSLVSKVAALYVQSFPDPVALAAVDQVESLTTGLSRKIWQKIMILDQIIGQEDQPPDGRQAVGKLAKVGGE